MDKRTKEYIESQSMAAGPVTNNKLRCRNCVFRDDTMPTAFCLVFKQGESRKPNSVLLGKGCPEYVESKNELYD